MNSRSTGSFFQGVLLAALTLCLTTIPAIAPAGDLASSADAGKFAPDFTSLATTGKLFSLSEISGRPVLLTFWSDWCSLEKQELGFLSSLRESYPDVHIVIVDSESDKPSIRTLASILRALEDWGIEASIIVDRGLAVTGLYGVETLPTSLVIDPAGRILHRQSNYFKGAGDEVRSSLDRVYSLSMLR